MSRDSGEKLKKLINSIRDDAISAIEKAKADYKHAEKAHNEQLRDTLAFLSVFVMHLESNQDSRDRFLKHAFWEDSKKSVAHGNIPILAARFVLGAKKASGNRYEQARTYSKAVENIIGLSIQPKDVAEHLAKETVYNLISRYKKDDLQNGQSAQAKHAPSDQDDTLELDHEVQASKQDKVSENGNDDELDDMEAITPEQKKSQTEKPPRLRLDTDVVFYAKGYMSTFMQMQPNEVVKVALVRTNSGDGWIELAVTEVIAD